MDSTVINDLLNIDYSYVFVSILVILSGAKLIISSFEWVAKWLGLETRGMREKRDIKELTNKHTKEIENLNTKYDSIIHRLDKLTNSLESHIQDSQLDNQAILRDSIMRLYRRIKTFDNQYILDQDLQNYISMFDRYSKDKGNGYVHDIIDPFMRSLPVFLSEAQAEEYFKNQ